MVFATTVLFTLFAGEAIRNTVSWWGFAAWVLLLAVASSAVLVSLRRRGRAAIAPGARDAVRWRSVALDPRTYLVAFLVWAAASLVWSEYPAGTLLGVVILAATTLGAAAVHRVGGDHSAPVLERSLLYALGLILALSLLFELVVATVVRAPVLPVFPIDVTPGMDIPDAFLWSRGLLLEGGRIQGILGNSNLLGFVALLAAIVGVDALRRRRPGAGDLKSRTDGSGELPDVARWVAPTVTALALAVLLLTRSSTVLVAAVAVLVTAGLALAFRRAGARRRLRTILGVIGVVLIVVGAASAGVLSGPLLAALGKSPDLTGRLDIWSVVGGLFLERPVAGWGWTGYWQPWIPLFDGLAVRRGVEYLQAHNAFLDVAFQLGAIGLLLFLALVALVWVHGIRAAGTRLAPLLLVVALTVQALAESRLLVEGNWALLVLLALGAFGAARQWRGGSRTQPGVPPQAR